MKPLYWITLTALAACLAATPGFAQRNAPHMQDVRSLVWNHASIERSVEEIPGGVRTVTTTDDPDLVPVLQRHPRAMKKRLDDGGMVRRWDPLFVELAKHSDKIEMTFKDIENGIAVESTSDDEEVVKLIRAHAAKVSEMAEKGHESARKQTPMPDDYQAAESSGKTSAVAERRDSGPGAGSGKGCCRAGRDGDKRGCCAGAGRDGGRGQGQGRGRVYRGGWE